MEQGNKKGGVDEVRTPNKSEVIQKDGKKRFEILSTKYLNNELAKKKDEMDLDVLKNFIFGSNVISKLTWASIDEYGPFNIIYPILDCIMGKDLYI